MAEGPVGAKWAGRFRLFRYEIRCWQDGIIPDADDAVSIVSIAVDVAQARWLLDLVPSVPTAVWGRDQLGTGDMWNSNSVSSWLLERSDIDVAQLGPPRGGRAPGWNAGLVIAARGRNAPVRRSGGSPVREAQQCVGAVCTGFADAWQGCTDEFGPSLSSIPGRHDVPR